MVSAKNFNTTDFRWMSKLKERGITEVHICGNLHILNTKKSLKKDLLIGTPKRGFVFSGLPSYENYWKILKEHKLSQAKKIMKDAFLSTILWEISDEGEVRSFGVPNRFEPKFTATVKDCMTGATKTIGGTCLQESLEEREGCCREKFIGPEISWGDDEVKYTLFYTPDPSILLKIHSEKGHRYCHSIESIKF